jgi:diguanylate cyclase (GGDEF)-like protein/PAS domain S-box-containing protein
MGPGQGTGKDFEAPDQTGRPYYGVILVVIVACLLIVSGEAWRSLQARETAQSNARRSLENLVQSLTRSIDSAFEAAETAIHVAEKIVEHEGVRLEKFGEANKILAAIADSSDGIRAVRILDSEGWSRVDSFPATAKSLRYNGQEYFLHHRDRPGTDLRIGRPVRAVRDNSWLLVVSRRLDDAQGRFAGVIAVSIEMRHIQGLFDSLDLGEDGAVSLQSSEGFFMVRRPFSERSIGLDASQGDLFKVHLPLSPVGTYVIRAIADGQVRYVSYRQSARYPLVVAAALSQQDILAGWVRETRQNGANAAAVVLAMAGLGGLVVLQLRRRSRMEHAAAAGERLAKAVFDHTAQAILVTDRNNLTVSVNNAFTEITGYTESEIKGRNPNTLSSGRHDAAFYEAMWAELQARDSWTGEVWNRRKSGEIFPEQVSISRLRNAEGVVVNHVAIFSDITQQKAVEEEIHKLAFIDPLTGLANRRLAMDRMQALLAHGHRERHQVAVMLLDVDHFKEINDNHGHNVGDEVLIEVARRMATLIREDDVLARLGGDEFVVGLGGLETTDGAVRTAERIMEQMRQPIQAAGREFLISSSLGIAMYPGDATDLATLLQYADQAMYAAKSGGRAGFRYFSKAMHDHALDRARREERLRRAVRDNAFDVHYQPQVELRTGRVVAAEALIRARDPELGGPAQFIPLAEEMGLMGPIGELTLTAACRQARIWRDGDHPIRRVAINVSAQQFADDGLAGKIALALEREGLPPEAIEVEVTESAAMADAGRTTRILHEIRALGVKIAIDDFGTGYSSLAYLRNFPINLVKIDRAFVIGIETDQADLELVRAVVSLSDALGLDTLAEGIETEAQRRLLVEAGCKFGQGYLFGKPAPAALLITAQPGTYAAVSQR